MTLGIKPLVAGNWKMNGDRDSLREITAIASGIDAALREKIESKIPWIEGELRDSVTEQFETLRHAESQFEEGRALQEAGNLQGAFDAYLAAHEAFPTEQRYLQAMVAIADQIGRTSTTAKEVRRYLERPGAEDPGGFLSGWLDGVSR